jgi:hypothetical protein
MRLILFLIGIALVLLSLTLGIPRIVAVLSEQTPPVPESAAYLTSPAPGSIEEAVSEALLALDRDNVAERRWRSWSTVTAWAGLLLTGIAGIGTAAIKDDNPSQTQSSGPMTSSKLLRGIAVIVAMAAATQLVSQRLDTEATNRGNAGDQVFEALCKANLTLIDVGTDRAKNAKQIEIAREDLLRAMRHH